jgi:hypothetical protein
MQYATASFSEQVPRSAHRLQRHPRLSPPNLIKLYSGFEVQSFFVFLEFRMHTRQAKEQIARTTFDIQN